MYNEKGFMKGTHTASSPDQHWLVVGGVQGIGFSSFPLSTHSGSGWYQPHKVWIP